MAHACVTSAAAAVAACCPICPHTTPSRKFHLSAHYSSVHHTLPRTDATVVSVRPPPHPNTQPHLNSVESCMSLGLNMTRDFSSPFLQPCSPPPNIPDQLDPPQKKTPEPPPLQNTHLNSVKSCMSLGLNMTRDFSNPFLKPLRRTSRQEAGTLLVSPTKFITNGVAGRLMMSVGVPDCKGGKW